MILPDKKDAVHKAWLLRILREIADDSELAALLRFKGGTYASIIGLIERFSVDLDFDLIDEEKVDFTRTHLEKIFKKLGLEIDQKSQNAPQYFVKYKNSPGERNTIRIDITFPSPINNEYEAVLLPDIDRVLYCETPETMFANKMVALIERYEKHGSIAGRDIFDIHTFFIKGIRYKREIIEERTGLEVVIFLNKLTGFIEKKITQKIIDEELNSLVPYDDFSKIRKILKDEVLMFLKDEKARN